MISLTSSQQVKNKNKNKTPLIITDQNFIYILTSAHDTATKQEHKPKEPWGNLSKTCDWLILIGTLSGQSHDQRMTDSCDISNQPVHDSLCNIITLSNQGSLYCQCDCEEWTFCFSPRTRVLCFQIYSWSVQFDKEILTVTLAVRYWRWWVSQDTTHGNIKIMSTV